MTSDERDLRDAFHDKPESVSPPGAQDGLAIERVFSTPGEDPFEQITWERRTARITDEKGNAIFEQEDVEAPADWSQLATNVVVSKYFYGDIGSEQRERSVGRLVHRVTRTIADWGKADGLFASEADAERFYNELTWLCLNQYGAFNSPVWFNVGLYHQHGIEASEGNYHWSAEANSPVRTRNGYEHPQSSACFIQSVADSMEDIMRLAHAEAMLFKYGSGTGTDLSTLRSSRERLAGGGKPSGPLSFMRVFDQIAAVVKSGGKTRRAAKMQSLRCEHPDILEFIECKAREEKKAWALIENGYDGNYNGEAYGSVMYQNANLSIRASEEFLNAALNDQEWQTYAVTTGEPMSKYNAAELLRKIAESCHICGDPGIQYHTTVNRWHTCPKSGPINASNPCSEFMFVDNSACNLASLNLMKFRRSDGSFDLEALRRAVRIFIVAQETLVDHASYPTQEICRNSHDFRPLGLGYANLGALLMSMGLPYDSDCGRATAAAVTAVMTAEAYATSAEIASRAGPFPEYPRNRQPMLNVMRMHLEAVEQIQGASCAPELLDAARQGWDEALEAGSAHGYRNAQASLLAPTGTIGFLMDCDTTGIEPDIALVKYKLLAGGGVLKLVNRTVPLALARMGYDNNEIAQVLQYVEENDTIEGGATLKDEHLAVFDCAFRPAKGTRAIHYMGHLRMMAAVQPFLSGAISKTVNMPRDSTPEEIMDVLISGWKMGLKAVAIYRDGSKRSQPLTLTKQEGPAKKAEARTPPKPVPRRRRLPDTRPALNHKFDVAGHEGYITVGLHEDGRPGEVFITMHKEGSTLGGMMDAFAIAISLCLQYGVPLEALVKKFSHQRFDPTGMTSNPDIPFAKSIVDYIFRWLGMTFLEDYPKSNAIRRPRRVADAPARAVGAPKPDVSGSDGPGGLRPDGSGREVSPEGVKDDKALEAPGLSSPAGDGGLPRGERVPRGALRANPAGAARSAAVPGDLAPDVGGAGRAAGREVAAPGAGMFIAEGGRSEDGGNGGSGRKPSAAVAPVRLEGRTRRNPERIDQQFSHFQEDAPACDVCGAITVRNGSCYKCFNCGSSLGCS